METPRESKFHPSKTGTVRVRSFNFQSLKKEWSDENEEEEIVRVAGNESKGQE